MSDFERQEVERIKNGLIKVILKQKELIDMNNLRYERLDLLVEVYGVVEEIIEEHLGKLKLKRC